MLAATRTCDQPPVVTVEGCRGDAAAAMGVPKAGPQLPSRDMPRTNSASMVGADSLHATAEQTTLCAVALKAAPTSAVKDTHIPDTAFGVTAFAFKL